jgi:hypothetical protein
MTGVPSPEPKLYRLWRQIAVELASVKDPSKALELAYELNCALAQQSSIPKEENDARSLTEEQLSPVLL